MKRLLVIPIVLLLVSLSYAQCFVESYFSPYDDVQTVVVNNLLMAQESVHCSLYGITNQTITDTMKTLIGQKVSVKLCLDKMQSAGKASTHKQLQSAGAEIVIKPIATLEHNKFCVIDKHRVIMGSFNFSVAAERQDNSMVVISGCDDVVKHFEDAFQTIHNRDAK